MEAKDQETWNRGSSMFSDQPELLTSEVMSSGWQGIEYGPWDWVLKWKRVNHWSWENQ